MGLKGVLTKDMKLLRKLEPGNIYLLLSHVIVIIFIHFNNYSIYTYIHIFIVFWIRKPFIKDMKLDEMKSLTQILVIFAVVVPLVFSHLIALP